MKLLVCFLVLQSTLVVSTKLDEVEKLLEDATEKLKVLKEPKKDLNYKDKDEELLEELEDFKVLIDGLCSEEVSRLSQSGSSRLLVGRYVPQCSSDGGYKPEQCHASTGYCWCVNIHTGKEIQGTRTRGPLLCGGLCADELSKLGSDRLGLGRYVPQCSSDGGYKPEQCHASTGYCWCVNILTGEEIQGTRTRGPLDCGGVFSNATSNGWSVGVTAGHSRRQGWSVGVGGKVTWGKDVQETKPSAENGWSVSASVGSDKDTKQTKPLAKNGWSISGSIGSGKDTKLKKPNAENKWSVGASVGSGKSWSVSASVGSDKDTKQTKPNAKNGWSIGASIGSGKDAKQTKPSAKNGWSVSASVGSDKDTKQTKPNAKNGWSIGGSIGFGKDTKQTKPSAKNRWSVSASVGSGKDAKRPKPAAASGWQILCDMTMKKSQQAEHAK